MCDRHGGLFLFLIPLVLVQLILRPFFPAEHHWADFAYTFIFFVSGYILYADDRFTQVIRRDWPLMLAAGIFSTLFFFVTAAAGVAIEWMSTPGIPQFYLGWSVFSVNSWSWSMFVLYIGMRYLDSANRWLRYGGETIMPFFVLHQPVIIVIAYFVVQWETGIIVKLLIVVVGSLLVTLGLVEFVMKRIKVLRGLFGMKNIRRETPSTASG